MNEDPYTMSGDAQSIIATVLPEVSRSFYITLKALPAPVRKPVSLGYLLARATDTLADTESVAVDERLAALDLLTRSVADAHPVDGLAEALQRFGLMQEDGGERRLISATTSLVSWLATFPEADRSDIQQVLACITRGQRNDLERFGGTSSITSLETAAELDEYTYLVAGCVGEFWTRVCLRHLRCFASRGDAEMEQLGVAFGKGLQLVNILRDLPKDLDAGRCYLPGRQMTAAGLDPRSAPDTLRPLIGEWCARARDLLREGWKYTLAVRSWRVRFACAVPIVLGLKTLALIEARPGEPGLKVPRAEVRSVIVATALRVWSPWALQRMMNRLSLTLMGKQSIRRESH